MATINPWKSSNLGFFLFILSATAWGREPFPVLKHVGVLPIAVEELTEVDFTLNEQIKALKKSFPKLVRESNRFHVLSDVLIESNWANAQTREKLKEDFGLAGFLHLTTVLKDDVSIVIVRLLDMDLDILLQETETYGLIEFIQLGKEELVQNVRGLIYRLLNMLPVDVDITSVSGRYVTLAGGIQQGLELGQNYKVMRSHIESEHPGNQSWLRFSTKLLGEIEVIEVKQDTSVARIRTQEFDWAIKVGDGIKLDNIEHRRYFAHLATDHVPSEARPIIISPMYHEKAKELDKPATPLPSVQKDPIAELSKKVKEPLEGKKLAQAEVQKSAPSPSTTEDYIRVIADDIVVFAGFHSWNYVGPGSTGSQFSALSILSTLGGTITRNVHEKIKYALGGDVGFGKTDLDHTYTIYNGTARVYWEDELYLLSGLVKRFQLGIHGAVRGVGVKDGIYGGGDSILGGIFGGVEGQFKVGEDVDFFDWYAELSIDPLTIGRIGYKGSHKFIQSSFGWHIAFGVLQSKKPKDFEFGLGFNYASQRILDTGNQLTSNNFLSTLFLTRYRF